MRRSRNRVRYRVRSPRIPGKITLAVAPDLHAEPFDDVMEDFRAADAVLVPGDLVNRHRKTYEYGVRFLKEAPKAAPVFYSLGNHERKCAFRADWMRRVADSEVTLLDDRSVLFRGIRIGGLSSQPYGEANLRFMKEFERAPEFRLLMCHHPEMWRDYVRGREVDLTLCGHAHGGQFQFFGRGIYAPGQGLFPKLTHGVHEGGRMIISRGMSNGAGLPRINNPCELLILDLEPGEAFEVTPL
ncbi:MAG: metallophosphoesterase [Clostridia bacterium]|nr:metallophosphoesterase [Clostridia bacterium]